MQLARCRAGNHSPSKFRRAFPFVAIGLITELRRNLPVGTEYEYRTKSTKLENSPTLSILAHCIVSYICCILDCLTTLSSPLTVFSSALGSLPRASQGRDGVAPWQRSVGRAPSSLPSGGFARHHPNPSRAIF